jgi:sporulation protein YlmC with PRC-barrel domain
MFSRVQCGYAGSSDWKRCEEERVVASEERLRELEEKYEGYKVYDNRGERIGKVDDLFIDEADREEYIGVKMGFLGRKSTLIPMDIVRVNKADRAIEVSESKDHVKDAPSFDDDEDITREYEERIRSHFGLGSQDPSPPQGSYGAYSDTRDEEREGDRTDREASADTTAGGTSGEESAGDRATSETPVTRQTEAFEEGGRPKVRRRIIREEIIEEDPDDRSS